MKLAIICAWRQGEDDLQATIDDAARSAGKGATIYAVQDKEHQGPGRTRDRGIGAATGADIICVIDAHMRFQGNVLQRMAKHVAKRGGLICPMVHHNPLCDFSGWYDCDSGGPMTTAMVKAEGVCDARSYYAGARIVYRAKDGASKTALAGKWSKDTKPGPCGCVMGACYVFRRDWYYRVGQPLSALPGWGCDEEALSIAAWMSGEKVSVFDGHVAHRYRPRAPWEILESDRLAVYASRMALIQALVTDASDRRELEAWQRSAMPQGVQNHLTMECERFRLAMLEQPRKWREWRAKMCEPDEIDGVQSFREKAQDAPAVERRVTPRMNPVITWAGVTCPHCRTRNDKAPVMNSYPNGNRRHRCPVCHNPFISRFVATA